MSTPILIAAPSCADATSWPDAVVLVVIIAAGAFTLWCLTR